MPAGRTSGRPRGTAYDSGMSSEGRLSSPVARALALGACLTAFVLSGSRAAAEDAANVELRMELVKADGKTESILIDEVRGASPGYDRDLRAPNKTLPAGAWRQFVVFVTRDPRAAVTEVLVEH